MSLRAIVERYGNIAVVGFISLEGMGLPLPGEVVLLVASALAATSGAPIVPVIVSAWIGTLIGGSGGYWIGRRGGPGVLARLRRFGLTPDRERRGRELFERHGAKAVLVARFIAVLRIAAGIFAGIAHMPLFTFSVCNAIGGLVWATAISLLGYEFGQNLPLVEHWLRRGSLLVLAVIIVAIVVLVLLRRRRAASDTR